MIYIRNPKAYEDYSKYRDGHGESDFVSNPATLEK